MNTVYITMPAGNFNMLALYDAAGRKVQELPVAALRDKVQIDVSSMPGGNYYLELRKKQGASSQRR